MSPDRTIIADASKDGDGPQSDYAALKAYGHSPAKAAEIILDAKRGDKACERWIALVRKAIGEQS